MKTSIRVWCAAIALVVVAGCGGGGESDSPAVPETSLTAPTVPATTVPTASERPADDKSDAGAIGFSEFVVNRVISVTSGANVDDLLSLASDDCRGCINLAQKLHKDGTVRQQFDGPPQVSDAKVIDTSDDGSQYLVEQLVVIPAGRKVDTATGQVSETLGESQFTFRVLMTWKNDAWVLTNYSAKKPK
jgi:hypothetical protein